MPQEAVATVASSTGPPHVSEDEGHEEADNGTKDGENASQMDQQHELEAPKEKNVPVEDPPQLVEPKPEERDAKRAKLAEKVDVQAEVAQDELPVPSASSAAAAAPSVTPDHAPGTAEASAQSADAADQSPTKRRKQAEDDTLAANNADAAAPATAAAAAAALCASDDEGKQIQQGTNAAAAP